MKAWQLLSDESKWTKGAFARDASGEETASAGENAVCWCAWGALNYCYRGTPEYNAAWTALDGRVRHIAAWNDTSKFTTVRSVLKELDI